MIWVRARLAMLLVLTACNSGLRHDDMPADRDAPVAATLMLHDSWWLQVRRDGEHALGFGALPDRVPVAPDGVDAPLLLDTVARRAFIGDGNPSPDPPSDCAYTVTLHVTGATDGLVRFLPVDLCDMLATAFRSAWAARSSNISVASDVVERAWENAPFQRR